MKITFAYFSHVLQTNQGIKNLTAEQADRLVVEDPDYSTRDLFQAIATKNFPTWTMYIQVMTFQQAEDCPFNPFDLTKVSVSAMHLYRMGIRAPYHYALNPHSIMY